MLKSLYLSATLMLVPFITFAQPTDRINHINSILAHISQTKKDIMFEMQMALNLSQRATEQFQKTLQDNYESTKAICIDALYSIVNSPEFATTIEQVTDVQRNLIINQMVNFNDIFIDPSAYPLEQKTKETLAKLDFDEKTEQIFNVYYIVFTIIQGSKLLLEKLELQEKALSTELETLINR